MGFYGNITNVANTTFQFDKIYSNRLDMAAHCNSDGIMVGRYVLVEYDQNAGYPVIKKGADNKFYPAGVDSEARTAIKYSAGEIPQDHVPTDTFYTGEIAQEQTATTVIFYQCNGGNANGEAIFKEITKVNSSNTYIANFAIDEGQYAIVGDKFTGFDSTVWVKTSKQNNNGAISTEYVNIANLNSVVPTFDVVADAPTMTPLTPHFDSDSTNVYYKLHMQSPYGFRVAEAVAKNDGTFDSDESTTWYETTYDKSANKTSTTPTKIEHADIYYNKAGFEERVVSKVDDDNYIKLAPSAKSGAVYSHGKEENDIQEFRLHLPAIGNMISDAWDIIHGPNRDDARTDENSSLQGRLDSFQDMKANAIPVKRNSDGTLIASYINGNQPNKTEEKAIEEEELLTTFDSDDAWIATKIDSTDLDNNEKLSGISIHHTWREGTDTKSNIDINDEDRDNTFNIVTPIADAAGHIIAHNTETITLPYGYKSVTIGEQSETTNNPDVNTSQVIADNVKDNLNLKSSNKWIRMSGADGTDNIINIGHEVHTITKTDKTSTNLNTKINDKIQDTITIQDMVFDEAGHVTANQKHTYTLPYGFKTIKTNGRGSSTDINSTSNPTTSDIVADSTQDDLIINSGNQWIRIDSNATNDSIIISHDIHTISEKTSNESLSSESTATTFKVPTYSFDTAGHYTGHDTKTLTMPFGYGKIIGDSGTTSASATFDTLAITADDKWLQTTVTTDKVNITHTGPDSGVTQPSVNNQTPNFGDTFTIEDWAFDTKGHQAKKNTHTVKIPSPKLNNLTATGSSVITGLTMITSTGDITQTNKNVGALILTGYEVGADKTSVSATDTINGAFAKLQNQITTEKSRLDTFLTDADTSSDALDTLKELQDYIKTHGAEAANMSTAINKNASDIANEITNRQQAISSLKSAAYTESSAYATAEQGTKADNAVDKTTYENKIADLESTIVALTTRIEALENPNSEDTTE